MWRVGFLTTISYTVKLVLERKEQRGKLNYVYIREKERAVWSVYTHAHCLYIQSLTDER